MNEQKIKEQITITYLSNLQKARLRELVDSLDDEKVVTNLAEALDELKKLATNYNISKLHCAYYK